MDEIAAADIAEVTNVLRETFLESDMDSSLLGHLFRPLSGGVACLLVRKLR